MVTLIPVYYPSFAGDVVLILEILQQILDDVAHLKWTWDFCFTTDTIEALSQAFWVRGYHIHVIGLVFLILVYTGISVVVLETKLKVQFGCSLWKTQLG